MNRIVSVRQIDFDRFQYDSFQKLVMPVDVFLQFIYIFVGLFIFLSIYLYKWWNWSQATGWKFLLIDWLIDTCNIYKLRHGRVVPPCREDDWEAVRIREVSSDVMMLSWSNIFFGDLVLDEVMIPSSQLDSTTVGYILNYNSVSSLLQSRHSIGRCSHTSLSPFSMQ